jgi:hypothetical protein
MYDEKYSLLTISVTYPDIVATGIVHERKCTDWFTFNITNTVLWSSVWSKYVTVAHHGLIVSSKKLSHRHRNDDGITTTTSLRIYYIPNVRRDIEAVKLGMGNARKCEDVSTFINDIDVIQCIGLLCAQANFTMRRICGDKLWRISSIKGRLYKHTLLGVRLRIFGAIVTLEDELTSAISWLVKLGMNLESLILP